MLLETPKMELGATIIDFNLPDPRGKTFQLGDLKGKNGTLIAFICNHCPYVKAIADRLAADAKQLQSEGIEVIAICSNDPDEYPEDSPPMMERFSKQHGFTFKYLVDEDQSIAKAYGAVCTPDFFGYGSDGKLRYRGRLDDAKMGDASQRTPELVNAMKEIATSGVGPEHQMPSMGCSIKWKN